MLKKGRVAISFALLGSALMLCSKSASAAGPNNIVGDIAGDPGDSFLTFSPVDDAIADSSDALRGTCAPACGKLNVECLSGQPEYDSRLPVGRMTLAGDTWCTAWIIAAPNILMTNDHCDPGFVFGLSVEFNNECENCDGVKSKPIGSYDVTEFIHSNPSLDYAIFRVEGDPASVWGVASVDDTLPALGQHIYEIHHGNGLPKGYAAGQIISLDVPGVCVSGTQIEMGVSAVATGGASGAPIFSADSHCVLGICHCGPPCAPGWGIPMSAILADAMPHLQNAGGQAVPCSPCLGANGDINDDGEVNGMDIEAFVSAALGSPTPEELCHGDFNGDGMLGAQDIPGMTIALLTE